MSVVSQNKTYAVVGASTDPDKYGHKVFADLLDSGYTVVPINPNADELLGEKVYPDLESYPNKIDTVVFVVPPKVTEQIVKDVNQLGINQVWMQPGSENQAAIDYCQEHDISVVSNACIMQQRRAS